MRRDPLDEIKEKLKEAIPTENAESLLPRILSILWQTPYRPPQPIDPDILPTGAGFPTETVAPDTEDEDVEDPQYDLIYVFWGRPISKLKPYRPKDPKRKTLVMRMRDEAFRLFGVYTRDNINHTLRNEIITELDAFLLKKFEAKTCQETLKGQRRPKPDYYELLAMLMNYRIFDDVRSQKSLMKPTRITAEAVRTVLER